jgi:hypothetical protein
MRGNAPVLRACVRAAIIVGLGGVGLAGGAAVGDASPVRRPASTGVVPGPTTPGPTVPARIPPLVGPPPGLQCRVVAVASDVSHAGWPIRDGCFAKNAAGVDAVIDLRGSTLHDELLGGHGNDTIFGGSAGDIIWGDYNPSGQPSTQVDNLHGGSGDDFIYSSHGFNNIWTGAGSDFVYLIYGHGTLTCGAGHKTIEMRKLPQNRHWRLIDCTSLTIIPYAA